MSLKNDLLNGDTLEKLDCDMFSTSEMSEELKRLIKDLENN